MYIHVYPGSGVPGVPGMELQLSNTDGLLFAAHRGSSAFDPVSRTHASLFE